MNVETACTLQNMNLDPAHHAPHVAPDQVLAVTSRSATTAHGNALGPFGMDDLCTQLDEMSATPPRSAAVESPTATHTFSRRVLRFEDLPCNDGIVCAIGWMAESTMAEPVVGSVAADAVRQIGASS